MRKITNIGTIVFLLLSWNTIFSQVGIGIPTPDVSSQLEVAIPDSQIEKKGVLIPRVALESSISMSPLYNEGTLPNSLLVFNTATVGSGSEALYPGYYYWYEDRWLRIVTSQDIQEGGIGNTTNVSLTQDGQNLVLTDSDGNFVQIALSELFQETVTTLVYNGNGTYTYTNEAGQGTLINTNVSETVTTMTYQGNGIYSYVNEAGHITLINTNTPETITTLIDNGDGTYTYTSENGTQTVISAGALETLTSIALNPDHIHIDYTDEEGNTTQLNLTDLVQNLETVTTLSDNGDGTYTYTSENGTQTVISTGALETLTSIALNPDHIHIDYTDEEGNTTQLNLTDLVQNLETVTTLSDNGDGTYTYTSENGTQTVISTGALETLTSIALNPDHIHIDYTDEQGNTTQLNLTDLVQNLETVTTLTNNGDGTYTYTSENGTQTVISTGALETLTAIALNPDHIHIDYTDEEGNTTQLNLTDLVQNLETVTTLIDNGDGTYTYTSENGTQTVISAGALETLTSIALNPDHIHIDYTDEEGNTTQLNLTDLVQNLETVTTLTNNGDGTYTYTSENGTQTVISAGALETLTSIALNPDHIHIDYTDEEGNTTQLNLTDLVQNLETITTLTNNGDGTYTYTSENGTQTVISVGALETLTAIALNPDHIHIDYTDEQGNTTQLNLTDLVQNLETVTTLIDNGGGMFTYINEEGVLTTFDANTTVLTDNNDGTYTFTNADGNTLTINTNALALNYDNSVSGLVAENVQEALDELKDAIVDIVASGSVVSQVTGTQASGKIIATHHDGVVTTVNIRETITTLIDNGDGTYTHTSEDGTQTVISTGALETLTSIALNPDHIHIDYTDEQGNTTQLNLTDLVQNLETVTTLSDNGDGTYTHTSEDGTQTVISTGALETLTSIALNPDHIHIDYTDEQGNTTQLNLTDLVQNLETITTLVDNGDGTYTYTNETGQAFNIVPQAENGVFISTDGKIKLGGNLVENTTITTTAVHTLSVEGLVTETADNLDGVVAVESTGIVRKLDIEELQIEPWFVQETTDKATENTQDIYTMGRVGIGTDDLLSTANTDVKLAVNGAILTTNAIYADYVFEDYFDGFSTLNTNYSFKTLKEVELFIKKHRHLPGVTSIDQLAKNEKGQYMVNISELSVQVLEKVEEVYLHLIEQQKELQKKDKELKELKEIIQKMEDRLKQLELVKSLEGTQR